MDNQVLYTPLLLDVYAMLTGNKRLLLYHGQTISAL